MPISFSHVCPLFSKYQKNIKGQAILASTIIPQPNSVTRDPLDDDIDMSFGSLLLRGLTVNEIDGDLETCCRAASVLTHILKDNIQCKERVLQVELDAPMPSFGAPEPLMHRIMKYLPLASSMRNKNGNYKTSTLAPYLYVQPIFLRLLVTWLGDCPNAVCSFLDSQAHLMYVLELVADQSETAYSRGLAAVILGECVLHNRSVDGTSDAFMVVDAISQKIGLTSYFLQFEQMQKSFLFISAKASQHRQPLSRSNTSRMSEVEDVEESNMTNQKHDEDPVLISIFDAQFINFVKRLDADIRECIVEVFSHPNSRVSVVPADLEQKGSENNDDYIKRLKSFVEKQCREMQELLGRNASLAEDLAKTGGVVESGSDQRVSGRMEKVQNRELQEARERLEALKAEKAAVEADANKYQNLAGKLESDLKSLSDAYNSLEQAHYRLESEVNSSGKGGNEPHVDVEAIKAEAREEAQKESEAELNDLLICLGQEQSKVEKLSARLLELGEDVDSLLEGIGDDAGLPEE